jgi:Acyl-CoA dehydrogenases
VQLPILKKDNNSGKPICKFGAIQDKLANIATDIDAARLLVWKASSYKDQGKDYAKISSMAKLFASTTAMSSATESVQIHGGYGYMQEYGIERLMRDAKITEIYEGTSEIQRLVISRELLK